jgi:outer membrane protein assembly factor BamB
LGNGISSESGIATEWGPEKNVAWRVKLPGPAGSTPIVWGDSIFLTSVAGTDLVLICFGTDGKERWSRVVGTGNRDVRGDEGNSAAPSPSTDGEHVWTFMGTGDLACFDFEGKEAWRTNLQERYGEFKIQFGMTSTPVLFGDRLYMQVQHGDYEKETQEGYVLALDKGTGREVWKVPRTTGAYGENEHSYASPVLYNFGNLQYLITHGGDYAVAYSLEGVELWRCGGLNPQDDPKHRYREDLRFVASPGVAEGIVVIPSAKNHPVIGLRPDASGDVTDNAEAKLWVRPDNTPDVPCPLIHDGLVYLCRENGDLICLDAKTGQQQYYERTHRDRHRASPVYADGRIYLSARGGKISIVQAGKEFKLIAQNDLHEEISSSPVISNGTLYFRTFDALWAIRK